MRADQIRETYLSYFEERGHRRVPSASLVPAPSDTSTLLTVAGMQPFKPYFLGRETPPASRLTSSQKCFRTPDIAEVGKTRRHLTFFEMLGNFSFGDYFKEDAIAFGWELSTKGFNFNPELIWITVFGGDEGLGLGPDTESIDLWKAQGVPEERIVLLSRDDNFWQGGATGPCGPCSEMYLDRGEEFGGPETRPGDHSDRYLEYWNHVFMAYELAQDGSLTPLPRRSIDTGLGLERMAVIQQGVSSVFETDLLKPLVDLAVELSGHPYDQDDAVTRSMRIVADHSRGLTFLLADGVVPSNEDRGYILRRVMRRAIQQGRALGLEAPWLGRFAERTIEMMGDAYPLLVTERETILRWIRDEEESFGRTLDRGTELLERLIDQAGQSETSWVSAEDAFQLHDTFGFPYEMTKELLAEQGLSVDDQGFEVLMEQQRTRARLGGATADESRDRHQAVLEFVDSAPGTKFVGYERLRSTTGLAAVSSENGDALIKLEESPFYAEGGGQIADSGVVRWRGGEAVVRDVYRVGDDQALAVEVTSGEIEPGTSVEVEVDAARRHAIMGNHTATHLLHAALREELGTHVRQAGSAVRPDKLRFDFTHGQSLGKDELARVEDRVNEWIKAARPVRWINMSRDEAVRLGAMALFGEKYGEWVRVVEVDDVSRELCGGTHVVNTAEIGIFKVVAEGSSAANVRRIEAITGPEAIDWFRERADQLARTGDLLGSPRDPVAAARKVAEKLARLDAQTQAAGRESAKEAAGTLAGAGTVIGGITAIAERVEIADQRQLLALAKQVGSGIDEAAIFVAGADGDKVGMVALFSPQVVERGLSAADVIREAAGIVGGGGGGREDMAQAGGRNASRLDEAIAAAREAIQKGLA